MCVCVRARARACHVCMCVYNCLGGGYDVFVCLVYLSSPARVAFPICQEDATGRPAPVLAVHACVGMAMFYNINVCGWP